MRVLVTGADGLLGSNLVRLLLKQGHEVSVFLFPNSHSKTLEGLDINKYYGDILKPETLELAIHKTEAIIHAAASTAVWPARSEKIRKINIQGTKNVVALALKYKIKRMVYIGSGSSVNSSDPNSRYRFPGEKFGLDYIDSKFEALQLVKAAVRDHKLPAIAVLPTFMLGPYDSLPSSGKIIVALAKGKLKFYTGGGRNFAYVGDVCTAIVNALEMGEFGKHYLAGGENLSYKEYFEKVARVVGKKAPSKKIPDFLVKSAGYLAGTMGKITGNEPMISYPVARISCEEQYVDSEDAINELKMPQTPLDQAIKECYDWFVDHNYC